MRTVIIWDNGEFAIKFAVVDGDYRRFNGVYVGDANGSFDEQQEISLLLENVSLVGDFPYREVKDGAYVITAGFIP